MTTLAELVADARHLRAWLESLPPDEVAGERRRARRCPLARCLADAGMPEASVHWFVVIDGRNGQALLSDALIVFVRPVDRTCTPLTAWKCLALLRRAERETAG